MSDPEAVLFFTKSYQEAVLFFNERNYAGCLTALKQSEHYIEMLSGAPHATDRDDQLLCRHDQLLFYRLRGDTYRALGRCDDAIRDYRRCTEIGGDAADYSRLAFAYRDNGDKGAAIDAINSALRIRPRDPDILADAGGICVGLGELRRGIGYYKKAVRMGALSPFWELGLFLPKAQARADRYKNVRVFYWMGLAYQKLGQKRRARRAFESALANSDPATDSEVVEWIRTELASESSSPR